MGSTMTTYTNKQTGEVLTSQQYQQRFGTPTFSIPESTSSFGSKVGGVAKDLAKSATESLLVKPAVRTAEAVGRTGLFGQNIKSGYEEMAGTDQNIFGLNVEGVKSGMSGAKQILGEGAETASWLLPGGKAKGVIGSGIKQGIKQGMGLGAASGGLFSGGQALQENKNLGGVASDTALGAGIGAVGGGLIGGAIPTAMAGARGFGDLSKQVSTMARGQAGSQPAKIMQRVARISKGKQAKFEQMAGESVGDYLTKRGIYGNIDDISTKLYDRFTKSKGVADDALAGLKGTFDPPQVKTALKQLMAREIKVSAEGAPSPDISTVANLYSKMDKGGWTMGEINQIKRLFEKNVKVGYLKQNLPDEVAKATNIDSAIRSWQFKQAETLGLKNLPKINKETQLAKQLLDELGREYSGSAGNNAVTLTDWIMLSGGDPTAIGAFLGKKTFSSKTVQSAIAKALNKGKPILGDVGADIGPSQVKALPAPTSGLRSQIGSDAPIKVAPSGSNMEMTSGLGITNLARAKPQSPQSQGKLPQKPLSNSSTDTLGKQAFGGVAGVEKDENGLTFNPEKAALGMAGMAGFTKAIKNIHPGDKKLATNVIDQLRIGGGFAKMSKRMYEEFSHLAKKWGISENSSPGTIANQLETVISKKK